MKVSGSSYVLTSTRCTQGNTLWSNRNPPLKNSWATRRPPPWGIDRPTRLRDRDSLGQGSAIGFILLVPACADGLPNALLDSQRLTPEPIRSPISSSRTGQDFSPDEESKGELESAKGWGPAPRASLRATGVQGRRVRWGTHPTAVTAIIICGPGLFCLPGAFGRHPKGGTARLPVRILGESRVLTAGNWPSPTPSSSGVSQGRHI